MKRTHKAIKLSLFGLAALVALVGAPAISAKEHITQQTETVKTPEEQALEIIKPFFCDPEYIVNKSFSEMCCQVASILQNSEDPILKELAKALTEVCKKGKNPMAVGLALKKYENIIKEFIGEMLPGTILYARLQKALKI
ncbi:MAG: hypothetical protein K2X90_01040 [Candidatus Babeliaceae bacterium]|nr:hypothetical protein [Candidatus Babeliaceae bacterium]